MSAKRRSAIVYVDGFNLYYGCLQGTPYRWVDPARSAPACCPEDNVVAIRYFTAARRTATVRSPISRKRRRPICSPAHGPEPDHPSRSLHNQRDQRPAPSTHRRAGRPDTASLENRGEGLRRRTSPSYLLIDGFRARYDVAVVVSNDGDQEPVRFVREDLKKPVGILNPHKNRSYALCRTRSRRVPFTSRYGPARSRRAYFRRRSPTRTARSRSRRAGSPC